MLVLTPGIGYIFFTSHTSNYTKMYLPSKICWTFGAKVFRDEPFLKSIEPMGSGISAQALFSHIF